MPVDTITGRYIPEDETDEQVQDIIESRADLIWFAEEDPDEKGMWLVSESIGMLEQVGVYSEEIEQRAKRVVDRHNKAVRKAIRAALEALPTSTQAQSQTDAEEDWLAYRPIVMVKLSDLVLVSEVNYLALSEEDRTEYDRITAVFTQGYKWAREIDQDGQRYAVFVHPSFTDSIGLTG